ncbi:MULTISPECIES: ABC transporter substrate-binding protein [Halocynthiibacter]|uniref:ABC transporter substrate-binding protein n=1 Tax=Halocynthiibacter halioticoli TaxID=2986804 RepID=A0AAE3LSK1_9RHOB|nr:MULTISPECIES: ABC transporter substrate-binding protein [Halocynthiibacter]MCV6823556.1 ABC transporter substrate-binding protein [Halocynthiibacter halioticoli]MCW4056557.1 ABC transporter substrate-binding protein [Halocynthiibacter sp. SDUM655004]
MNATITCGFLPLVDCVPLVVAREFGFARSEGIDLRLSRYPSWSTLRDMLAFGQIDTAHMLAPTPIAMSLSLGGFSAQIDTLMVLSVNGNSIGVHPDIAGKMRAIGWDGSFTTPRETGEFLLAVTGGKLRIGSPFPFAMHTELLRHWLTALGMPEEELDIRIVPPPHMPAAMAKGEIDAFCVGEPWGSSAVENGHAELVLPGSSIWSFAPEKTLAARRDWVDENPNAVRALMRAVYHAAEWLHDDHNRMMAANLLARQEYLNLSEQIIDRALSRRIVTRHNGAPVHVPEFQRFFSSAATFPWRSQAAWIATRLAARNGLDRTHALEVGKASFRSDLYRQNLAGLGIDLPGASEKLEGALSHPTAVASTRGEMILGPDAFFNGEIFDLTR